MYRPAVVMVPTVVLPLMNPSTDQVTAVLVVLSTVAENCWVAPDARVAELGETATETGAVPLPVAVMMTVLLNTAPELSQAFTVMLCCPADNDKDVLS